MQGKCSARNQSSPSASAAFGQGFDRTSFAFKGTAGSWQGLLGSASQAFNLRTKVGPQANQTALQCDGRRTPDMRRPRPRAMLASALEQLLGRQAGTGRPRALRCFTLPPPPTSPAQFAPAALNPYAKLPTMRSVEWRLGGTTVLASVLPPTGSGGTWRLAVTANGQAVVGSVALPGGVTVRLTTFAPAANGVKARVTINAGAG